MKIIWRDTELTTHTIDLTNAVDVKIDGVAVTLNEGKGIRVSTNNKIIIMPMAANAVMIKESEN